MVIWIVIEIDFIHDLTFAQVIYLVSGLMQLVVVFALLGIASWLPRLDPLDTMPAVEQRKKEPMSTHSRRDLSGRQQTVIHTLASVELALAATAWADLVRRPAAEVNGRKRTWAALIGINFIGPLAYFRWGQVKSGSH